MGKKRVLFVDDEPNILSGMQRMLRSLNKGLDMVFAENGREALSLMEDDPFDIVISDMRMPGMDGSELLAKICEKYPATIRIMLTGQADSEAILRTVTVAHQFLAKPCEPDRLKNTLHRACHLHNLLNNSVIRKVVANIGKLPSMPSIYLELQDILADPECSVEDVAACISKDIGMSAKILQLVNTAFFGLFKHVESPAQAAHLLGLDTIKSLVLSVHIFSQYEEEVLSCLSLPDLWDHSIATGAYAKKLAEAETQDNKIIDDAFIAGMLHDIGKLILAVNMPDKYQEALERAKQKNIPLHEAEYAVFDTSHAEIGAYLLGLWGLPGPVIEAIAHHHRPVRFPGESFDADTAAHVANVIEQEQADKKTGCPLLSLDDEYLSRINCVEHQEKWRKICAA